MLPRYLEDLINSKKLDRRGFSKGFWRFVTTIPNIAADYPLLNKWLSKIMFILHKADMISYKDADFVESKKP